MNFPSRFLSLTAALAASAHAVDLPITQDGYLEDGRGKNDAYLMVENDGRTRVSYLKVDLAELPSEIKDATLYLKLTIASNDPGGSGTIKLYEGSETDWTEDNLSVENAPAAGALLGTLQGKFKANEVMTFDLASYLSATEKKSVSLVLQMEAGGNDVWFDSTEGAVPPALIVNDDGSGYDDGSGNIVDGGSGASIGSGGIGKVALEGDGIVVLEIEETASPLGKWQKKTDIEGFTGDGYLEFPGNNYETGPPDSPLQFSFKIQRGGIYHLHLHCARETQVIRGETRDDVANDAYVRVEGNFSAGEGPYNSHRDNASLTLLQNDTKFYGGDDNSFVWASGDRLDPGGKSNKRNPVYNFKAGETYKLTVSGRSKAFKLDRILFRHDEVAAAVAEDLERAPSKRVTAASDYQFVATEDFPKLDQNAVPYYRDKGTQSLAIDATELDYRKGFAKAARTFEGSDGSYQVRITTVTEEDGESIYKLLVNGQEAAPNYQNPFVGPDSPRDLKPHQHVWENVILKEGDALAIESNAATNGKIPENGGTAWSRGRWQKLELFLANALPVERSSFAKEKDLLLAQFDSKPDADDIHAQAALGSMLAHPDLAGVDCFAVAGAIGIQDGAYIDSTTLFNLAFGRENTGWTNASGGEENWNASVKRIRERVQKVLAAGGKVWVQEAGQSDITRDWIEALIAAGVSEADIQENVIVVQHSPWNEKKTTSSDLTFVQSKTDYRAIDDGNADLGDYSKRAFRGDKTPGYVSEEASWLEAAQAADNPNLKARALWTEAVRIIDATGFKANYSEIPGGGVDFSDCVENWWIFEIGEAADSVAKFWERYVINVPFAHPPVGRVAVVADGNSPDPDDIGATAVMFGILKGADLQERLVHLSHSCDLKPFQTKNRQRISAADELRRQQKLHELCGEGIAHFGPFPNLKDYYNCRTEQAAAVNDLRDAINASSARDPLWIISAGEPDVIGYALEASEANKRPHVHVISHHPANDDSGDTFTWAQILAFGVTEHQVGDQNVALKTAISEWDWIKSEEESALKWIWNQLDYAEKDGVVSFQTDKFDCSDAGMLYWWITGADKGGSKTATPSDMRRLLQL